MVHAGDLYCMLDMLNDFSELHAREFALFHVFAREAVALDELAAFIVAAPFRHFRADGFVDFRIGFFRIAEFLAQKAHMVVDLHDSALCGEILHHLVRHVARRIANRAA